MKIKFYEYGPTRSLRVRWTLQELGIDFDSKADRSLIGSDELRRLHPLARLPAVEIDGRPLFESAAICTYLADSKPESGLIAAPGSWDRALHDQWVSFSLTELEAWLWSSARHTFIIPEEQRIPAVLETNAAEVRTAAAALDKALDGHDFLVADRFSVTDIIVAYAVNWARKQQLLEGYENLLSYVARLKERPHCTLD